MVVNWGIAAAGRITNDFVNALGTIPGDHHNVVAVGDPDPQRAIDFAKKHNVPKYYGSFEELAKDSSVDIIYIGTINPFHYKVAKLMLENGNSVLCEKPLTLKYSQAEELYKLAEQKNVFFMEAMWSRCFPSYKYLLELIQKGTIGEINEIHVTHGFKAVGVERILTRNLGGGITLDIGLYSLQLAQLLYGKYPESISTKAELIEGVDVRSELLLEYENGKKLYAKVSAMENLENKASLKGSKGEIILENYWCCDKIIGPNGTEKEWPLPKGKFDFNHTNGCGLRYEAEVVRECLEKGLKECPLYTYQNSLDMIKMEVEVRRQMGVIYDDD